nr:UV radiation resistance associated gene protein [Hymenolepis microstoma]
MISDVSSLGSLPGDSSPCFVFHFCKVDQENQASVLNVYIDTSRFHFYVPKIRLDEVRNQLSTEFTKNSELASRLSALISKHDVLKCKKSEVLLETQFLHRRLQGINNRIRSRRSDVTKMTQLCNLRRFEMIRDLNNCYPIEFVGRPSSFGRAISNPSDCIMTICGLLLLESEAPGNSAAPAAYVDTGNGTLLPLPTSTSSTFNINNYDTANQEGQRLSQSLRGLSLSNRPPTATAAIFHVICLLQLLSTILNVPLKYPLECGLVSPRDAFRPRIIDPLFPCSEGSLDETFPLYSQRNTAAYRHAIYLFNQNIVSLRTYFNLQTTNPLATLWNIRNLFEARLLNVSPKPQREMKSDNHSTADSVHLQLFPSIHNQSAICSDLLLFKPLIREEFCYFI